MTSRPPLRFLHCADLRLDSPFQGIQALDPDVAEALHRATFDALDRVVDTAISEGCDFVAIAGNAYDAANHSLRAQLHFAGACRRLADHGIGCFVAHGPQDPPSAWDAALPYPETVHRFSPEGDSVTVSRDGREIARLHGWSWASASARPDFSTGPSERQEGVFTVAIAPGPADVADTVLGLAPGGIDYWALGSGSPALLRQAEPWVVRSGPPQGLEVAEAGRRGCYVVSVSDDGTVDCRLVPTAAVAWFEETLDVGACATRDEVIDAVFTKREEARALANGVPALLDLRLTGQGPAAGSLHRLDPEHDLAAVVRDGEGERPDFVWLATLRLATTPDVDVAQRRQVEDLAGDFLRSSEALRTAPSAETATRQALASHPEQKAVAPLLAGLGADEMLAVLADAEALGLELLLGEAR